MISEKMIGFVKNSSIIRAMFEEGKRLDEIYGAENVYDFSLGNPSVEPPLNIKEALISVLNEEEPNLVHGYMNNSGYIDVREKIALSLNKKFNTNLSHENIVMTVGAAGGLNVILKSLLNPGDEVVTFAPFFGEYRNYVSNYDGILVVVPPNCETFQPNLNEFEKRITGKTKAVIVNSPNNPTGVVYSEDTIRKLAEILNKKQQEYNTSIYLISDEPYRELVYDNTEVPYLTKYYKNTIVVYSYSKSLSLPGERIGYLVIPSETDDYEDLVAAANVATRILGFVNAPSLIQRAVARCLDVQVDVEVYNRNRELLYNSLMSYGYECVKPQGAFYLFVKALEEDDKKFAQAAKKYNILIVPGSSFDCPGYVRIAYCVDYDMIKRSLPGFKNLARDYGRLKD
ncbi:aspartate aminotransferase [Herbinix hemicellulosilytica]|uniref:Aminotransferase n=1 Tax=Herbinix hemicellulosilytica TaxID=1564487 RepID=A0A0H5SST0_HERHM|nr:pyridoxal phosphate-dependent aminotransferase [Herbinix hemicellulosilytica]RBP57809.1 aspartate aminotransferase [Herbinix hemicellulosilytica]CRZ33358.1 putative aspartate aminotransferase YhdR [Herbinix hemicellulosilytica]